MLEPVTLTARGLIVRRQRDGEIRTDRFRPESAVELRPYLWRAVRIEEGTTLADLCALLDLEDLELLEWLLDCSVAPYVEEALAADDEPSSDLEVLEVYRHADPPRWSADGERWEIRTSLHGWGPWSTDHAPPEAPTEGGVAIEFTPVGELAGLELRYDPELRLWREDEEDVIDLFRGPVALTLVELLRAVFTELDTFGSPEDRDAARTQLEELFARREASGGIGEGISAESVDELFAASKGEGDGGGAA